MSPGSEACPGAIRPLTGVGVLVTRPEGQAAGLVRRLEEAGADVLAVPLLAIGEPADPAPARAVARRLGEFDLIVFVSANAVHRGLAMARALGPLPALPRLAAVGKATAAALEAEGLRADLVPSERFDSESLLALEDLQGPAVRGRRVLIVRGEGGRDVLAQTLRARGAQVVYAEVYRRERPPVDRAALQARGEAGRLQFALVTSGEVLDYLLDLVPPASSPWLRATTLVVPSERLAAYAARLGYPGPVAVAPHAGDAALVGVLLSRSTPERGDGPGP